MLTITVVNVGGASIAHTDPEVVVSVVRDWAVASYQAGPGSSALANAEEFRAVALAFDAFSKALRARDYQSAGIHAERLGLHMGLDHWDPSIEFYAVPVDPADETNCESCQ